MSNSCRSDKLEESSSSTISVSQSIREYRRLHGRTFQNFQDVEYWGPNDERQNEGLDLTHHMLCLALDDKMYMAPIDEAPQRVIDIGTGTGIWAIDFADDHPSAEVIGTDLSPIQPGWVPTNCRFELDDAQLEWTYPDNHFDFVHIRLLMGSIKDWPTLYSEVMRCLKPGGWIEHLDYSIEWKSDDETLPEGSGPRRWTELMQSAGEKLGQTFKVVEDGRNISWLGEAGFESINSRRFKLPAAPWPKDEKWREIGAINELVTEGGLEGYTMYMLTQVHGWDYNEVQTFLIEVRQFLRDRKCHAYHEGAVVWAQKPMDWVGQEQMEVEKGS